VRSLEQRVILALGTDVHDIVAADHELIVAAGEADFLGSFADRTLQADDFALAASDHGIEDLYHRLNVVRGAG
jgi:hypothetical protein